MPDELMNETNGADAVWSVAEYHNLSDCWAEYFGDGLAATIAHDLQRRIDESEIPARLDIEVRIIAIPTEDVRQSEVDALIEMTERAWFDHRPTGVMAAAMRRP